MQHTGLAKVNRMERALAGAKNKLREGTRIGGTALIGGFGGGFAAGLCEAKWPVIPGTTLSTAGIVGSLAIATGLMGWAGDYSDELAALGTGMIASSISKEAERYFRS